MQNASSSRASPPPATLYPNLPQSQMIRHPSLTRKPSKKTVDCVHVLNKVFGKRDFRGKQKEVVDAAMLGADILVIAPTGMGKSLCFQVPAVAEPHGITIVVSPLLALMKSQVASLRQLSINAFAFTSGTSESEKARITKDLQSGHPKTRLLYITPEKLQSQSFMKQLQACHDNDRLNRLVVDEAHCITEWGDTFRKEYGRLGSFRQLFPDVPIMALTASATKEVQDKITASLDLSVEHLLKVVHPFNRSNLFYEVRYFTQPAPEDIMKDIASFILQLHTRRSCSVTGVIYCRSRASCDALSAYLRKKGLAVKPYHRGVDASVLHRTLAEWQRGGANGGIDAVCATVAFGMGIDKSDVRYIVHYDLPVSVEGYYQETGRAGRDGMPARCILYYSREDAKKVQSLIRRSDSKSETGDSGRLPAQRAAESLMALIKLAETTSICRHVSLCRFFGEVIDTADKELTLRYCSAMCDICKDPVATRNRKKALSTEDYVATQAPRIERELDDEWGDDNSENFLPPMEAGSLGDRERSTNKEQIDPNYVPGFGRPILLRSPPVAGPSKPSAAINGLRGSKSPDRHMDLKRKRLTVEDALPPGKKLRVADSGNSLKGDQSPILLQQRYPLAPTNKQSVTSKLTKQFKVPNAGDRGGNFNTMRSSIKQKPPRTVIYPGSTTAPHRRREPSPLAIGAMPDVISISSSPSPERPARGSAMRSSSPVDVSDDELELEVVSGKVPAECRTSSLDLLRRALHQALKPKDSTRDIWKKLRLESLSAEDRAGTIRAVTPALEFRALGLCTSAKGYNLRIQQRLRAIKALPDPRVWDESCSRMDLTEEIEDAREVVQVLLNSRTRR